MTPITPPITDEPRRHRLYLVLLGLTALATAPWPFIGRPVVWVGGLPLWLWWSLGMTAAFAALTAWGLLRYWRGEEGSTREGTTGDG